MELLKYIVTICQIIQNFRKYQQNTIQRYNSVEPVSLLWKQISI